MCLITKNKVFIAEEDIICYKVVYKNLEELYTLYQKTLIPNDKHLIAEGEPDFSTMDFYKVARIDVGVIHSFKYFKDAKQLVINRPSPEYSEEIIYKCIIPKGTKYYHGIYSNCVCFGSKEIQFIEELSENEDITEKFTGYSHFDDITSYEDALMYLNKSPLQETGDSCVDAFIKLKTIAEAWNKLDEFEPDPHIHEVFTNIKTNLEDGGPINFRYTGIYTYFIRVFMDLYKDYYLIK